jgi:2-(1,2-epoxy-1,2-dihydrophenyl)acetyl-CoA isomerase
MSAGKIDLSIAGNLAEITIERPDQLNALDVALARQLLEALTNVGRNPSIKAVLLKGSGRAFMAGGDIKSFHEAGERAPEAVNRLIVPFHGIIRAIRDMRAPVIAAVQGAVAGGGVALALACDFVIASQDALFTPAYLRIATSPDGGTTWAVTRLLGARRALEWLMLGEPMNARQALELGLINRVVPLEQLNLQARALAMRIGAGPAQAQASLKRLVSRAVISTLEDQLVAEAAAFTSLSATPDFREGLAAFFERREPRFSGEALQPIGEKP